MGFYRGEEGSVKFDDAGSSASAITSTRSWSLTLDKEVLETTVMGDTYAGNVAGIISGRLSICGRTSCSAPILYTLPAEYRHGYVYICSSIQYEL